jgi:hypothetical protein
MLVLAFDHFARSQLSVDWVEANVNSHNVRSVPGDPTGRHYRLDRGAGREI